LAARAVPALSRHPDLESEVIQMEKQPEPDPDEKEPEPKDDEKTPESP